MYRTHTCSELRPQDVGKTVEIAGWISTIRDHGGVKFIDLRDHYGTTQVVVNEDGLLNGVGRETVIQVVGQVVLRGEETVNEKIETGLVEVTADEVVVLGKCTNPLPFEIEKSTQTREEVRLKYRFLDLRNPEIHKNIVLRAQVLGFLRLQMEALGFTEIQTPILTASSPEGARDFLVPSRKSPGKFFALPQAPQQFKQMLMASGFDRYYQIAPCFRDEDARQDRSPGEFYQLDFEMAFAKQEDVFEVAEKVLYETFVKFGNGKHVTPPPFQKIAYKDAMLKYGSDKPDLRNPLTIVDLTDFFADADFPLFKGKPTRGIVANCNGQSRKFFEDSLKFAMRIGLGGLGYLTLESGAFEGPIEKHLTDTQKLTLIEKLGMKDGDTVFFVCDTSKNLNRLAGLIRAWLGDHLNLIQRDAYKFCFVMDFPMYELNEETGMIDFTHNPFSMPQGGMDALNHSDPLEILAYQYDIVVNGVELSSGAVRNHDPDIMIRAFEIAGYDAETLKSKFGALYTAFQFGAPPHAGMAPGVDRMLMLLAGEETIRDIIAFPLNGNAQDLLFEAPSAVSEAQLRDIHYGSAEMPRLKRTETGNIQTEPGDAPNHLEQVNELNLTEEERFCFKAFMEKARAFELEMAAVETADVTPMIHVQQLSNVLREDAAEKRFTREALMKNAPSQLNGYWQVPRLVQ